MPQFFEFQKDIAVCLDAVQTVKYARSTERVWVTVTYAPSTSPAPLVVNYECEPARWEEFQRVTAPVAPAPDFFLGQWFSCSDTNLLCVGREGTRLILRNPRTGAQEVFEAREVLWIPNPHGTSP